MTPDPKTLEGRAELRRLCGAATPNLEVDGDIESWTEDQGYAQSYLIVGNRTIWSSVAPITGHEMAMCDTDARLFATARTALPAALEEIERLTAECGRPTQHADYNDKACKQAEAERDQARAERDDLKKINSDWLHQQTMWFDECDALKAEVAACQHDYSVEKIWRELAEAERDQARTELARAQQKLLEHCK